MSRQMFGVDRGVDGWWQAVEVSAADSDRFRIGESARWSAHNWKIVGISKIKPLDARSVVIRLELRASDQEVSLPTNTGLS